MTSLNTTVSFYFIFDVVEYDGKFYFILTSLNTTVSFISFQRDGRFYFGVVFNDGKFYFIFDVVEYDGKFLFLFK